MVGLYQKIQYKHCSFFKILFIYYICGEIKLVIFSTIYFLQILTLHTEILLENEKSSSLSVTSRRNYEHDY